MNKVIPRSALGLQTAMPLLTVIAQTLLVVSVQADAERFNGPPYYLPFVFACLLFTGFLVFSALLLWFWRSVGWYLSMIVDVVSAGLGVALFAYILTHVKELSIDGMDDFYTFLELAAIIPLVFGLTACLLAQRSSRRYFGLTSTHSSQLSTEAGIHP